MPTKWVYEITPAAQRDLKRLPRPIQVNILAKVVALAKDPMLHLKSRDSRDLLDASGCESQTIASSTC